MKAISLLILISAISMMTMMQSSATMAEKDQYPAAYAPESEEAHIYIVFTEKPHHHARTHYIHILSRVLGSKHAAKKALIHVYTRASTGFSAWLTPRQADEVSRQHKVILIIRSRDLKLEPWNSVQTLQ